MSKRRAALALCAIGFAVAGALKMTTPTPAIRAQTAPSPAAAHKEMPDHKAYEFMFRRIAFFRRKVAEAGKPLAKDTGLRREAGLNDQHLTALEGISADCLREAEALDAEAMAVIREFRARNFPGGKAPAGQKVLPPPPPELEAMQ